MALQGVTNAYMGLLGGYKAVTRGLQWDSKAVTRRLQEGYGG